MKSNIVKTGTGDLLIFSLVKSLGGLTAVCFLLYATRIVLSETYYFGFLIWNLFLAFLPVFFSYLLFIHCTFKEKKWFLILNLVAFWFFFFPNAPYIITDFLHLRLRPDVPLWYDGFLLSAFSITGLFAGFISLYFIHLVLKRILPEFLSWIAILLISLASGYGVYLGRELRFNTWDIVFHPFRLSLEILHSFRDREAISMTLYFFVIVFIGYTFFYFFMLGSYKRKNG